MLIVKHLIKPDVNNQAVVSNNFAKKSRTENLLHSSSEHLGLLRSAQSLSTDGADSSQQIPEKRNKIEMSIGCFYQIFAFFIELMIVHFNLLAAYHRAVNPTMVSVLPLAPLATQTSGCRPTKVVLVLPQPTARQRRISRPGSA